MTFFVYKYYSGDDVLLYVGQTKDFESREYAHKYTSSWYKDVHRVERIKCQTRNSALNKERMEIKRGHPKHNVCHNYVAPPSLPPITIPREFDYLIIDALGGIKVVRHLLGRGTEVIARWCKRGIPIPYKTKMMRKYRNTFIDVQNQICSMAAQ